MDCIESGRRGDTTRLSREIDGPIQVGEGGGLTKKPYIRIALHLRNAHCIEKTRPELIDVNMPE